MNRNESKPPRDVGPADRVRLNIGFFRDEFRRRRGAMRHVMPQIERAMRMLSVSPLLRDDACFHNLVYRISLAGTPDDFADRFADLHQYVLSRSNQAAKGGAHGERPGRSGASAAPYRSGKGGVIGGRRHLGL
ncbi:hypothetical protein SIAM614_00852 [Stappia aggregata IAM 12614]|uniref:Uncharacterized protein n=2 Tax=Roseibium aggregatum TaxID=187304 RepID=A0P2U3_ROSAI|nr:hypothetical protein SIAM614_00852 [Stappia aggregata IAM 12614] [Roseibium aggregatum IAM 12614]